jgi:hypothetical protein
MWWIFGADPAAIAFAVSRFAPERRSEMWAGIGTAIAYAGGGPPAAASVLVKSAGPYRYDFLSGIPLAAHMRDKGKNGAEWTERVCMELVGLPAAGASQIVVAELTGFLDSWKGSEQDKWYQCYMALRERIRRRLANDGPGLTSCETGNAAALAQCRSGNGQEWRRQGIP